METGLGRCDQGALMAEEKGTAVWVGGCCVQLSGKADVSGVGVILFLGGHRVLVLPVKLA